MPRRRMDASQRVIVVGLGRFGRSVARTLHNLGYGVTAIDIDHVDYLGETREAIGREKAGIFRPGRPAICGDADPPASLVDHARAIGAPLWLLGRDFRYTGEGTQWRYEGPGGARYGLPYPALRGPYQLQNAATALAAIDALRGSLPVAGGAAREGLVSVELPGRLQVLPGRPAVVLDVAHNPHAARALAAALASMGSSRRTLAVFGMLKDKDIEGVVRALAPRIDAWYVAPLPGPRGGDVERLVNALLAANVPRAAIRAFVDVETACAAARDDAGDADRIAAFGSFLTVAAVLDAEQRSRRRRHEAIR